MNWIRKEKRLAIYLRDGMACCYCGAGVEDEVKLTLDHLLPHAKGGTNEANNLVTCCHACNSSRGDRRVEKFIDAVAAYVNHGVKAQDIKDHVMATIRKSLNMAEAKSIMARRGGFAAALASLR